MVSVGDDLTVVTPSRWTSSGKRGIACDTRFCTSCCALSGSVPSLNVTVVVMLPSLLACDCMYSIFSTPLICSSMGDATVSAITFGFAPGYCARTTTEGGTTSGYSAVGNFVSAITPARRITTDSTAAKIGLSMKNFEMFMMSLSRRYAGWRAALTMSTA
jgi:hypothetical protein